MDTFCLIFKDIGDYILPLMGIALAAGAIAPGLGRWFAQRAEAVMHTRWKRWLFGLSLGLFCVLLIASTVRIQLSQERDRKQEARERSPVYQRQEVLKFDAQTLAKRFLDFAAAYPTLPDAQMQAQEFRDDLMPITDRLLKEGLDTSKLVQIYNDALNKGKLNGDAFRAMAAELNRLAGQLPNTGENP